MLQELLLRGKNIGKFQITEVPMFTNEMIPEVTLCVPNDEAGA